MAVPPDVKFTHIGAEFPSALDEDIEWRAQRIESTSRIYRAAKRKNEPKAVLNDKAKQLYEAIEDMFKYVKHLKDKELEDQLRYIQDSEPTLRTKRAKAYVKLETVHRKISRASWNKKYGRPRE
jgi:CHASE3 domain sensor protein